MVRILFVVGTALHNAGVPRVLMDIIESIDQKDYVFDVLTFSKEPGYWDTVIKSKGGIVFHKGINNYTKNRFRYLLFLLVRPWQVFQIIFKGHYDIIHSHCGYLSGWEMLIGKICRVNKRISHAHGTYNLTSFNLRIGNWLLKKFATHRIACSKNAGDTLFSGSPYNIIYNSVKFSDYEDMQKEKHNGLNFLQVGYFCGLKNQLFSIKLCKRLKEYNKKPHLFLIGFDLHDGYTEGIKSFIYKNELEEDVTILPHDYNKFMIYPIIDYILMPSTTEGLPIVAIESQAAKIVCITSEAIPTDVDMGLLKRISINSIEEWVDYILEGPKELSFNERKAAQFSRETFINKMSAVYRS